MWSVICIWYFLLNLNILSGITRPSEKRWYSGQHFILNLLIGIYKRLSMINLQIFCKIIFSPVCWCFFFKLWQGDTRSRERFQFSPEQYCYFFPRTWTYCNGRSMPSYIVSSICHKYLDCLVLSFHKAIIN